MEVALPTSGAEARKLGAGRYFTGVPCLRGHTTPRYSHNGQCLGCSHEASKSNSVRRTRKGLARAYYERQRSEVPEKIMLASARSRAKKLGIPCTINAADIRAAFPKDGLCPITGAALESNFDGVTGNHKKCSPSLDKIIPELGYVPGNIAIISMHANKLKGDETNPAVFRRIADWIEGVTK